ncbi:unnamed protein product, partial [Staurois parvus]
MVSRGQDQAGSVTRQKGDRMQVQGPMGNIHQGPDHRPGHSL